MKPWFTPGLSCWYVWAMNLQNNWLSKQVKTAVKSYRLHRARKRADKNDKLWFKKMQDAYLREYIRLKMEQYKKDNNIEK